MIFFSLGGTLLIPLILTAKRTLGCSGTKKLELAKASLLFSILFYSAST